MKRKIFLLFASLLLIAEAGLSQITFQKIFSSYGYGGCGMAVQQTSDEGYIIGGYLADEMGWFNMCLIRTDKHGDTLWVKKFKTQNGAIGYAVQQTKDGGFIIGGTTVNSQINGFYVVKTNYNGDVEWSKIYSTFWQEDCSIQQTYDGGYIMAGNNVNSLSNESKMYVIKTNEFGDTLWTKGYGSPALATEYLYSIKQTYDGCYVILGSFIDTLDNSLDIFLIKTDTNGNILWSGTYGGTGTEWGNDVQQTHDGGYIIAGRSTSFGNPFSGYIIRTDENGNVKWSKVYNQADTDDNGLFFQSVREAFDGGLIIGGFNSYFAPNMFLLRTDRDGNINWAKSFGGTKDDGGYAVQPTADGGYIFSGYHAGEEHGLYLVKTDGIGNSNCNQFFNSITTTVVQTQTKDPAAQIFSFPDLTISDPNTIVSSGCTIFTPCFSDGIPDNSFTIVPNPCVADFTIYSPYYKINKTEIFNSLGKAVYINDAIHNNSFTIFSEFPAGIYMVRLTTGEKILNNKLVIGRH